MEAGLSKRRAWRQFSQPPACLAIAPASAPDTCPPAFPPQPSTYTRPPTPGPGQPGHSLTDALALAASKGEVLEVVGGLVGHGGVHGEAVWVEGVGLIPQLGGPAAGGGEM